MRILTKNTFFSPIRSLMTKEWILQVSDRLQVPSVNYGQKRFASACFVVHEILMLEGIARAWLGEFRILTVRALCVHVAMCPSWLLEGGG